MNLATERAVSQLEPLTSAQKELVRQNVRMVEKTARDISHRCPPNMTVQDLVSLGYTGLTEAARSYDPTMNVPFPAFASYRIQGAMLDGIRKEASHAKGVLAAARSAGCNFLAAREDTSNVLTDTEADARQNLEAFSDGLVAAMVAGLASAAYKSNAEDSTIVKQSYSRAMQALERATERLAEREKKLIHLHYREDMDLKQVAKELGVSYSSIRRYHHAVMERLAMYLRMQGVSELPQMA